MPNPLSVEDRDTTPPLTAKVYPMRIILATIALALPASAQDVADFGGTASSCAPSPVVYAALETQFHEARVYFGLSGEAIIEIWRADTGTFTVLATTAGGSSCIIAAGEEGREVAPKPNI